VCRYLSRSRPQSEPGADGPYFPPLAIEGEIPLSLLILLLPLCVKEPFSLFSPVGVPLLPELSSFFVDQLLVFIFLIRVVSIPLNVIFLPSPSSFSIVSKFDFIPGFVQTYFSVIPSISSVCFTNND